MRKSTRIVEVRGASFHYDAPHHGADGFVFRMDEFTANQGERIALIGPSGSGKTTLLHLIAGIYLPDEGSIEVLDQEISAMSDAERRRFRITNIGMVFQEFELLEYLSVFDNIVLPYRLTDTLKQTPEVDERARRLADAVGLCDKLQRRPGQLSQGERQRVSLCRALLTEPSLILADEPTGNLDPATRERVLDLLFGLVEQSEATLIHVTHEVELVGRFDRLVDLGTPKIRSGRDNAHA